MTYVVLPQMRCKLSKFGQLFIEVQELVFSI